MARTKKIPETINNINRTENTSDKPEEQFIVVPTLGSLSSMGNVGETNFEDQPEKTFNVNVRLYSVYLNGEFIETISENSEKLDKYLLENKKQLETYIHELNENIEDSNLLIFFHEGKQDRNYLTFDAYYAQNGLAPKVKTINSWMQFYKTKYPLMTEEEIAIKVKGNLKYSFTIDMENNA